MDDRKLVFIKLEGELARKFEEQRLELEKKARRMDPGAIFPPEMFVSYMLDVREAAAAAQKGETNE